MARKLEIAATALLAVCAVAGCGGGTANTPPPAAPATAPSADDDAMAGVLEHHRYHHHGGVTLLIAMSLDTLGVSPEQRATVEKIRIALHARMEPARVAEQNLLTALADGLASANLDAARVDAAVARVTEAAAAVHDASAEALNELHAVLTPPQRAALVDKVESHWTVWQNANAEKTERENPDGGRLAVLAADLDLTPEQLTKIRADLGEGTKTLPRLDPQELAEYRRAFGDAFQSATFDARALTNGGAANAHMVGWGAAETAHLVEVASPVLTPDQRTRLAQKLRDHANHDPSAQASP